jgi:two-component system response regulator AtoC
MSMEKILIVDDDDGLIHFLTRFFSKQGYDVASCTDASSGLDVLTKEQFDLILLDYKMPGLSGLDSLKEIRKRQIKTPVIVMTAYGTTETAIEAMKRGAYDYLLKPFDRAELNRIVVDALELNHLMKEVVSFPSELIKVSPAESKGILEIIGNHRRMQEVYKLIGQIAGKDVTVLITGESGTGKELVAGAIYHHSHRTDKPFLTVNCAAIPDTLFESELFGYERGAFTGAEHTHIGKLERCNGGTIFFDEIGDMSLATQAKVLRVLQEGELERLGGTETIKVDTRTIAATNKNLEKAVEEGKFREDLYWRLKIISIQLPPLRDRLEDIPALLDYFLARFSDEYGKPVRYVADAAIHKLKTHHWQGNVREFKNCVRRAVLLSSGDVILDEHVKLQGESNETQGTPSGEQLTSKLKDKLEELVTQILPLSDQRVHANVIELVEEMLISKALQECGNNQVKAAKMLGISRNTLRHRKKKYNIDMDSH